MYPDKLCQAIVNGTLRQKEIDESDRVSTNSMSIGQLNSFTKDLCLEIRRERIGAAVGGCSSVTRDGSINRPVGDWPADWVDTVHDEDGGDDKIGVRPQSGVRLLKEAMYGLICRNSVWKAWESSTSRTSRQLEP